MLAMWKLSCRKIPVNCYYEIPSGWFSFATLRDEGVHDIAAADDTQQFMGITSGDNRYAVIRFSLKQLKGSSCRFIGKKKCCGLADEILRANEL